MNIPELEAEAFEQVINGGEAPVFIDFYADWCGPCKQLEPRIEALALEYGDSVDFYRVNVDDNQDLAGQFGIRSIPTLMLFKDGEKVEEIVGSVPKQSLQKQIDCHLD